MLRGVELHNFMSFKDVSILGLDGYSTIAVSGENGHGKSALLESIYYALYGEGRTKVLSGLVQEGEDEMQVDLLLTDRGDKEIVLTRGISNGKGWAKYMVEGEIQAEGAAVEKLVRGHLLGVDASTFLLTTFFGLGANDTLMKVRASERLETMQSIASINIYSDSLHPTASKRSSDISRGLSEARGALEALEGSGKSLNDVQGEIASVTIQLAKKRAGVSRLQIKQKEISDSLDQMTAFNSEKKVLSSKLAAANNHRVIREEEIASYQADADDLKEEIKKASDSVSKWEKDIEALGDEEDLETKRKKYGDIVAECYSAISLRETALKDPHDANCPLCGHDLKDVGAAKAKWSSEIERYRKRGESADVRRTAADQALRELRKKKSGLEVWKTKRTGLLKATADRATPVEKAKAALQKTDSEISSLEQRIEVVSKKVKELAKAFPKAEDLQKRISEGLGDVGKLEGGLEALTSSLEEAEQHKRDVQAKKREIRRLLLDKEATELVASAFSRYGIPLNLIQGLCGSIEEEATVIYNSFDSGQIEVADTDDRGKPGVDFFLINRTGRRSYEQLSEGQKVMVFLAVRLALSKIISRAKGIKHDFLVLDEITSHLSPTRRDDLTTLITDVLGRSFSQVFMVSHTEVRDIFSAEIVVEMKDAISTATLL
jgi:DNA repair exonuclease SbcCD ATPase subunit